jgi:hypothetical protein
MRFFVLMLIAVGAVGDTDQHTALLALTGTADADDSVLLPPTRTNGATPTIPTPPTNTNTDNTEKRNALAPPIHTPRTVGGDELQPPNPNVGEENEPAVLLAAANPNPNPNPNPKVGGEGGSTLLLAAEADSHFIGKE